MVVKAEDAEKNRFTMNPRFVFPQCNTCLNLNRTTEPEWPTCKAFPYGIPEDIIDGYHDHMEEYPGDKGVRYDPIDPEHPKAAPRKGWPRY